MIESIYHDQGKPCPNPKQLYYDMWDAFGQKNALFLSAEYKGETIGGAIIILDRDRALSPGVCGSVSFNTEIIRNQQDRLANIGNFLQDNFLDRLETCVLDLQAFERTILTSLVWKEA